MLFNSIEFAFFLPIVFCLFWLFNKNLKLQNGILLLSSYYFYSCWDWRFLSLILISFDALMSTYSDYYNFNELISLSYSVHFYDSHHLNQSGVEVFNEAFIELITK